jgi:hypothetical protein
MEWLLIVGIAVLLLIYELRILRLKRKLTLYRQAFLALDKRNALLYRDYEELNQRLR